VSQVIAQARDLSPWDGGLGTEPLDGQGLHGSTDFQQSDPDGIEYQAVRQVTSLQMGADGIDGCLNVGQSPGSRAGR